MRRIKCQLTVPPRVIAGMPAAASLSASAANCDLVSINLWTRTNGKITELNHCIQRININCAFPAAKVEGERTSTTAGSATASRCRKVSRNCDSTPVDGTERLRAAAQYPSAIMSIGDNDLDSAAFEGPGVSITDAAIGDEGLNDIQSAEPGERRSIDFCRSSATR